MCHGDGDMQAAVNPRPRQTMATGRGLLMRRGSWTTATMGSGYVRSMDWSDVTVALIALVAALAGAWWGGRITAKTAKATQMRSIYIEEWRSIKEIHKSVARLRPLDFFEDWSKPDLQEAGVHQLISGAKAGYYNPHFEKLYDDLHSRFIEFLRKRHARNEQIESPQRASMGEQDAIDALLAKVEEIENCYRSLIDTGRMPPRTGGMYTPPPPPWPGDAEQTGDATHT